MNAIVPPSQLDDAINLTALRVDVRRAVAIAGIREFENRRTGLAT